LHIDAEGTGSVRVTIDGKWRDEPPRFDFRLPGCAPIVIERPDHIRAFMIKRLPTP
jgi:hypothetical protein